MREKIFKVFEKVVIYALVAIMAVDMAYMPATQVVAKEINNETSAKKIPKKETKVKTELTYKVYSSSKGWLKNVKSGKLAGKDHKDIRAISMTLKKQNGNSGIKYKAYITGQDWTDWKKSGQTAGSTKKGKTIEAIKIKLSEELEKKYDIYYRLYIENEGWSLWAKNGATAGQSNCGKDAEYIQVELIKKDKVFKENKRYPTLLTYQSGVSKGTVRYVSQIENVSQYGWIYEKDGKTYDFTSIADGECAIATACMALSYLGIDLSPGEFCYKCGGGSLYFGNTWARWRKDVTMRTTYGSNWKSYYDAYKNDENYKYSPVIIQLTHYCYSDSHYVLLVGKNDDGTYKIYDCYMNKTWNAKITGGYIYGLNGKASGSIGKVCQYYK